MNEQVPRLKGHRIETVTHSLVSFVYSEFLNRLQPSFIVLPSLDPDVPVPQSFTPWLIVSPKVDKSFFLFFIHETHKRRDFIQFGPASENLSIVLNL